MGVNQNMPQAVVHGPSIYQGLNIPNYSEQMIAHIQTLVKFGQHTTDVTGFLVRACGELLRLELGIGGPIFQISHHLVPCVTPTWLSQCWLFCVQRGIEIRTDIYDFQPNQRSDREIMHIFLSAGFRTDELATLNRCRMYLRVIFLSDICNGTGTAVDNQFWVGEKPSSLYQYNWPQTPKPTQREWTLWQRALTVGLNLGRQGKLALPLGKWRKSTYLQPGLFTDTSGEHLYRLSENRWATYQPILLRRRTHTFSENARRLQREEVPTEVNRATVYLHGKTIILTGHGPIDTSQSEQGQVPSQHFWNMWKCEYTLEGKTEALRADIMDGKAVAVSDGSFQLGNGAAAWTIEGAMAQHRIKGTGQTPGSTNDQSAYRSELFGLWGILYSLK